MAAIPLVLLMSLALIPPALCQATYYDYSAPKPLLTGGPNGASSSPPGRANPMIQHLVAVFVPPPVVPVPKFDPPPSGIDNTQTRAGIAANNEDRLSPTEMAAIRRVIEPGRSTALEVAAVNIAVKGTSLLMYFFVWLLGLAIFRYVFNRWFDEDVYTKTWPSVVVITTMIICTAWVLVSTVQ
jgi:hypothetical protein